MRQKLVKAIFDLSEDEWTTNYLNKFLTTLSCQLTTKCTNLAE